MQLKNILVGLMSLNAISAIAAPAPAPEAAPNALAEAEAKPAADAGLEDMFEDNFLDKRSLIARAEAGNSWYPQRLTHADERYYDRRHNNRRPGRRGFRSRYNTNYYNDGRPRFDRFGRRIRYDRVGRRIRDGRNRRDSRLNRFGNRENDDWDW